MTARRLGAPSPFGPSMNLIAVTHGAVDWSPDLCVGQSEMALSDTGFTAVQRLAASWPGPSPRFLVASDSRQCRQSAQVFAAQLASEPLFDPRLREIDLGEWQGRKWKQVAREDRERYGHWLANPVIQAAPGGESFTDLLRRSGAWLASMLSTTRPGDTVLAVTHVGTLRALLCHTLGLTPARSRSVSAVPAGASLIRCHDGRFEVCYLNATQFQDAHDA